MAAKGIRAAHVAAMVGIVITGAGWRGGSFDRIKGTTSPAATKHWAWQHRLGAQGMNITPAALATLPFHSDHIQPYSPIGNGMERVTDEPSDPSDKYALT